MAGLAITIATEVGAAPGSPFPLDGECLDYVIVDVFVGGDRPFAGNPLAVVLGGDRLTSEQCQTLAVEFHLSETVFPMAPTAAGADYRARIFTIASELPFAGHPSVGAAWVLSRRGLLAPGTATQQCGAGLVTLDIPASAAGGSGPIRLTGPTPVMSEPVDPTPLLAAVGLDADDVAGAPPRIGGSGVDFAYLCVTPDALAAMRPDLTVLAGLEPAVTGVFAFALGPAAGAEPLDVRARMFASDIGGEDPATGSASLGLGGWLVASGVAAAGGETRYDIRQGVEMGRASLLQCDVSAQDGRACRVRVAGRVAAVATGRIRIP